jgi:hypothetical protein
MADPGVGTNNIPGAPHQHQQQALPAPTTVYGIAVGDLDTALKVKRVLTSAALMALVCLISSLISIATKNQLGGGFVTALLLPLCAYHSVRSRSRSCLNVFWCCSLCCSILFVLSAVITFATVVPLIQCACDFSCVVTDAEAAANGGSRPPPGGRPAGGGGGIGGGGAMAKMEVSMSDRNSTGWADLCADEGKILSSFYASVIIGAIMAALQCYGAWAGKRLADHAFFAEPAGVLGVGGVPIVATYVVQPHGPGATNNNYPAGAQNTFAYAYPVAPGTQHPMMGGGVIYPPPGGVPGGGGFNPYAPTPYMLPPYAHQQQQQQQGPPGVYPQAPGYGAPYAPYGAAAGAVPYALPSADGAPPPPAAPYGGARGGATTTSAQYTMVAGFEPRPVGAHAADSDPMDDPVVRKKMGGR